MSIVESIREVIASLPPEQQAEALSLLQQFRQAKSIGVSLRDPYATLSLDGGDIAPEEFENVRREMWKFREEDAA